MLSLDERRRWFLPAIAEYLGLTLGSFRVWLKLPRQRDLGRHYARRGSNVRRHRFFYTGEVVEIEARFHGPMAWATRKRKAKNVPKGRAEIGERRGPADVAAEHDGDPPTLRRERSEGGETPE